MPDLQREYEDRKEREYQEELEARDRAERELEERIDAIKSDGGDINSAIIEHIIDTAGWENALKEFLSADGDSAPLKALIERAIKEKVEGG